MTIKTYRGTYVVERQKEDGEYEVLLSVSEEVSGHHVQETYDDLLSGVSEKIEKYRSMLHLAEEDPSGVENDAVPNAPTIRSVENKED